MMTFTEKEEIKREINWSETNPEYYLRLAERVAAGGEIEWAESLYHFAIGRAHWFSQGMLLPIADSIEKTLARSGWAGRLRRLAKRLNYPVVIRKSNMNYDQMRDYAFRLIDNRRYEHEHPLHGHGRDAARDELNELADELIRFGHADLISECMEKVDSLKNDLAPCPICQLFLRQWQHKVGGSCRNE